ncbi:MAG: hypothetical protein CM15mV75_250 [uncultured marine virus]|nr:MAG: hypothetical protein CM15mV75_250 [uncultured marine virus]
MLENYLLIVAMIMCKIVNSSDDDDDYYLKFVQANAGTANQDYFGEGVWVECPAPNIEIEIDKDTMPVRLN